MHKTKHIKTNLNTFSTANLPPTKIAQHSYIFIPTTTNIHLSKPTKNTKKKHNLGSTTSPGAQQQKPSPPRAPGRSPGHRLPHHLPQRRRDTWHLDVGEPTAAATGKRQIVLGRHRLFGSWWGVKNTSIHKEIWGTLKFWSSVKVMSFLCLFFLLLRFFRV